MTHTDMHCQNLTSTTTSNYSETYKCSETYWHGHNDTRNRNKKTHIHSLTMKKNHDTHNDTHTKKCHKIFDKHSKKHKIKHTFTIKQTVKNTIIHSSTQKRTETTQWHAMTHTKQVKLRNKNLNNDKHNDPPTHQIAKRHTQSQKGTPYSSYNETHNNTQYYLFKFNLGKF